VPTVVASFQLYISATKALNLVATLQMATEREDIEIRDGARAESDLTIRGSKSALLDATNDDTLVENGNPLKRNMITIDDWSQTGRGSHVEFRDNEIVPLEQGERAFISTGHELTTCLQVSS
jgi:hypothetical protein